MYAGSEHYDVSLDEVLLTLNEPETHEGLSEDHYTVEKTYGHASGVSLLLSHPPYKPSRMNSMQLSTSLDLRL